MSQAIRFSEVSSGQVIGTATLTDAGTLEYENDLVAEIMGPMCAQIGDAKAFSMFDGWSNGYVQAEPVDDEEPDDTDPGEANETGETDASPYPG